MMIPITTNYQNVKLNSDWTKKRGRIQSRFQSDVNTFTIFDYAVAIKQMEQSRRFIGSSYI